MFADHIRTHASRAVAFLDNKQIVFSATDSLLKVCDDTNCGTISVPVVTFVDMVVCNFHHCIYMVDAGHSTASPQSSPFVIRFELGSQFKKSIDEDIDSSTVISVTHSHDLLVMCPSANALKIFNTDLIPLKCVLLQSDIVSLTCAVELTPGRYVLTHGKGRDALHRVCVVNSEGKLLHTYGCLKGSYPVLLDSPGDVFVDKNGFVYVDDVSRNCVIVLSPTLVFIHRISPTPPFEKFLNKIRRQMRMDKESGHLYVKCAVERDSYARSYTGSYKYELV